MKNGKNNCTYFNFSCLWYIMGVSAMGGCQFCMLGVPFILSFELLASIRVMFISKCDKKFAIQKGG